MPELVRSVAAANLPAPPARLCLPLVHTPQPPHPHGAPCQGGEFAAGAPSPPGRRRGLVGTEKQGLGAWKGPWCFSLRHLPRRGMRVLLPSAGGLGQGKGLLSPASATAPSPQLRPLRSAENGPSLEVQLASEEVLPKPSKATASGSPQHSAHASPGRTVL